MNAPSTPRSRLWLALPPVLVLLTVWTAGEFPLDYWLHVNTGRWMAEHSRLVAVDDFSHTIAGQEVRNQPWLAQLAMYWLHEQGGYALNQCVAGAAYAVGLFGVTWLAWRRSANSAVAGLLGVAALAAMANNLGVRPQYFSVVLFAAEMILLMRVRTAWAAAAGTFAIVALWTNLHGAYPLGVVLPAVLAAAALGATDRGLKWRRFWRYAAATVAGALGVFVRPDPQNSVAYVLGVSSKSVARGLEEWLPPAWDRNAGAAFFAAIAVAIFVMALSRRRSSLAELAMLIVFFAPAVQSQRMAIWWALVLPVALARPAASVWRRCVVAEEAAPGGQWTRAGEWAVATLLVGLLAASTPWTRTANPLLPAAKRIARPADEPWQLAARWSTPAHSVRTYAPLQWAPYFTWHSHGMLLSFVDSRVDFFPDEVWNDYQRIAAGDEAALALLDGYQVELVMCDAAHGRLAATLRGDARWQVDYEDPRSTAFRRATAAQLSRR